eukprot:3942180-Pleurochrysis_carterae.AAC.1
MPYLQCAPKGSITKLRPGTAGDGSGGAVLQSTHGARTVHVAHRQIICSNVRWGPWHVQESEIIGCVGVCVRVRARTSIGM